jgi:hypothetical protein
MHNIVNQLHQGEAQMYSPKQFDNTTEARDDLSIRALRRRVSRNIDRALALDDAMFQWQPRHVLLVLTLTYEARWKDWMTIDDLRHHRDTLLNNAPFNMLLKGINGYDWKIEEGQDGGGLHMHLVIYYEAGRCDYDHHDVYYAEAIKKYWEQVVTKGRGYAWNSNASKTQNALGRFGDVTGLIDRNNVEKRQALRSYLEEYLCKEDQQVAARAPHFHMFGTSQFPDLV